MRTRFFPESAIAMKAVLVAMVCSSQGLECLFDFLFSLSVVYMWWCTDVQQSLGFGLMRWQTGFEDAGKLYTHFIGVSLFGGQEVGRKSFNLQREIFFLV